MNDSHKFILLAIAFLLPVTAFLLNWGFYYLGKAFWKWYLPKLRRNSKLRYRIIELKKVDESLLYVETSITILFFVFVTLGLINLAF